MMSLDQALDKFKLVQSARLTDHGAKVCLPASLKNVAYVRLRFWDCTSPQQHQQQQENADGAFLKVSLRQILFTVEQQPGGRILKQQQELAQKSYNDMNVQSRLIDDRNQLKLNRFVRSQGLSTQDQTNAYQTRPNSTQSKAKLNQQQQSQYLSSIANQQQSSMYIDENSHPNTRLPTSTDELEPPTTAEPPRSSYQDEGGPIDDDISFPNLQIERRHTEQVQDT